MIKIDGILKYFKNKSNVHAYLGDMNIVESVKFYRELGLNQSKVEKELGFRPNVIMVVYNNTIRNEGGRVRFIKQIVSYNKAHDDIPTVTIKKTKTLSSKNMSNKIKKWKIT